MTATRERPEWADWPRVLVRVPTASRDRTVPDAPTRPAPCDPDGEPWAIDPDVYRRVHRPALTRRRLTPLGRAAWWIAERLPALIVLALFALLTYAAFREMTP